jgi:hypothetical protein
MPTFGKVEIKYDWIAMKVLILSLSCALPVAAPMFFWVCAAIFLYFGIGIFHEFIHAIIILKNKGEIHKIYLGYPDQYIDYKMSSLIQECSVFKGGALTEFFLMCAVVSLLLYGFEMTRNMGYVILLIFWIWIYVTSELLPPQSDFMQYKLCLFKIQMQS